MIVAHSQSKLIQQIRARDIRTISRIISQVENRDTQGLQVLSELFVFTGKAQIVGITGAPGAGKSTLVDRLAKIARAQGKQVAIVCIDPSSPFSGGSILGDRIRMVQATEDPGIYVRSMATRGTLGGLSNATWDVVCILDAAGFEIIFIETVGVGQAEVDIVRMADTSIVVLVPGMGDSVQAMKAGILEIADVFVINKADREGADLIHKDLRLLISLAYYAPDAWKPSIVKTIATSGDGLEELREQIEAHYAQNKNSGVERRKRESTIEQMVVKLLSEGIVREFLTKNEREFKRLLKDCIERKIDPYTVVKKLLS